ncbi:MAG: hypothetical protein IJ775_06350 [Muribaculaceae bacterium]|nr:hypothetical protein [Muribaculaceae bacterium]
MEQKPDKQLKMSWPYYVGLVVIGLFFYVLNVLTTLKGDDVLHGLLSYDTTQHITDWASLMRSQAFHYVDTNGRMADFLAQLCCGLLHKPLFNVINALVAVLFFHAMTIMVASRKSRLLALSLVLIYVMTLMSTPGETMLWMSGATNYLWAITFTLVLLLWLRKVTFNSTMGWGGYVALFLMALIAGAMNESVSAGTLLGLVVYYAFNRKSVNRGVVIALGGYVIGVAIIFASPGVWQRLEDGGGVNMNITVAQMMSRRFINTCTKSVHFITPVLVMAGVALLVLRRQWQSLRDNQLLWVFLAVFVSVVVLSLTNSYRGYTAFSVFSFLVVAQWIMPWLQEKPWRQWVCVALLVCSVPLGTYAVRQVWQYKQYDDAVIAAIKAGPAECILPAVQSPVHSRWVFPIDYDNEAYFPHKVFFAHYYGKSDLQFLTADIYSRYASGKMMEGGVEAPLVSNVPGDTLRIMAFPGHPYSIIDAGNVRPGVVGPDVKVHYASMEEHLGKERSAKLKRWGEFPEYMPMRYYCLNCGGRYFVVLPEITDDIVTIEIPSDINGKSNWRRFDRKTPSER